MRVLMVGNLYPPHGQGGYEVVWRSFATHLRVRGDAVRILCSDMRRSGAGPEEEPNVHRDLHWHWRDGTWVPAGLRAAWAVERHNRRVFDEHVRDFAPDAVMWWSMGGISLSLIDRARRAGLPAVAVVHDSWLVYGRREDVWARRTGFLRPGRRRQLARAGTWTFNSAAMLDMARADGWDVGQPVVIHPGIAADRFPTAPARAWGWRLAYVGRVDPQKGVGTLVESLALLPVDATAEITGPGPEAELTRLRELAARLHVSDRVRFHCALAQEELAGAYAAADAVIFPVTWAEPFGLVPLEAMAVGRPVVATGTGGSSEYLRDGDNALLFEPGDAAGLAAALHRLANHAELRDRLRAEGLRTAARFTQMAFNQRLEQLLRDAQAPGAARLRRAGR